MKFMKNTISAVLVFAAVLILSQISQFAEVPTGFFTFDPTFPWGLALVAVAFLGLVHTSRN
jgi:hypothetical protein